MLQFHFFTSFLILGIFSIQQSMACMPHSPDDVFIARFQSSQQVKSKRENFEIQLSSNQFVLRSLVEQLKYTQPKQWHSTFSTENIPKNRLIIGLAYIPDSKKPEQYQISSFATLNCENDRLSISEPIQPFVAWDRNTSSCAHTNKQTIEILDGFIKHDQAYYLAELQQKYPTCAKLNTAFPTVGIDGTQQKAQQFSNFKIWFEKFLSWLKSWF